MKTRKFFLNLPVADLKRSMDFFKALGFEFNAQFTGENAACMIIGADSYAMLLTLPRFKDFTKRAICDTATHSEGLFAFDCSSRDEVDQIVHKALASGGSPAVDPQDHGFMYGWSFCDPDGHHWEVFWMDASAIPVQNG